MVWKIMAMVEKSNWARDKKRLAVQFPAVKSSLYLTYNLFNDQLPLVLWRWHVNLMSQTTKQTNKQTNWPRDKWLGTIVEARLFPIMTPLAIYRVSKYWSGWD